MTRLRCQQEQQEGTGVTAGTGPEAPPGRPGGLSLALAEEVGNSLAGWADAALPAIWCPGWWHGRQASRTGLQAGFLACCGRGTGASVLGPGLRGGSERAPASALLVMALREEAGGHWQVQCWPGLLSEP